MIILLISHTKLFFTIYILLGQNKIKQKFGALGIAESRSKGMWPISHVTLMIDIILYFDVPTLKYRFAIIYLTDRVS